LINKDKYGIKVSTILNAADTLQADLEYLCSLIEKPDPEFLIKDALAYSSAVIAISNQVDFIVEDISKNDLSEDESYVKLSEEEIVMLSDYNTDTEEAIQRLEIICGISLQNN
jgi:pantoate kinase